MPQSPRLLALGLLLAGCMAGCATDTAAKRVVPSYDTFTSQLVQLAADQDGDGSLDQWSYLDSGRPLRGEADTDRDQRIDRWEYFGADAQLRQVGTSSRNDGIEDTWTLSQADGETRIDHSRHRDRQIDLREFYRGGVLIRAEEDTNADGSADKWDRYENGILREVAFDTTLKGGRPDRRLRYDAQGRFIAAEGDADGDGTFEPVALAPLKSGRQK
jgi:hypothetical protein